MAFNFFGFGRTRKTRRTVNKAVPPKLLKIAKRYRVKTAGKSVKTIKAQCAKVIRRKIKAIKKKSTKSRKSRKSRRSRFGATRSRAMIMAPPVRRRRGLFRRAAHRVYKHRGMYARRAALLGALYGASVGARRGVYGKGVIGRDMGRVRSAGRSAYLSARHPRMVLSRMRGQTVFGKRRRTRRRASKAMFGRRRRVGRPRKTSRRKVHRKRRTVRRYRFGNGGNPPLMASTGYEFCSGGGGVLGANSTGLFPSPCMGGSTPKAAFGKRRRRRM
jgi:hypothetical protein